jgi:hypothetical protein
MSPQVQKHALPCRSIAVRFAPISRPQQDGFDATLCAKALNRLRDSKRPQSQPANIIPRGEIVGSGGSALS